ncbi:hypothetical protein CHRYSEOSP005_05490 [Chryseobacterium sp. Alg-005]
MKKNFSGWLCLIAGAAIHAQMNVAFTSKSFATSGQEDLLHSGFTYFNAKANPVKIQEPSAGSYQSGVYKSVLVQDSDGDGITDDLDLDDDNDGILDTVECPSITNHPVYHLYDDNISSTNFLDLYKQLDGIGSTFVCPVINCSVNPYGSLYKSTNITGSVTNLAYDDSKYYTVDAAGNLLYTNNIINGTFTNLGNANIGTGFLNLAYDNGIFYHWKRVGTTNAFTLYSSPDPTTVPWVLMGTVNGRVYSFTSGGYTYELKDMAVDDGVFYFMYYSANVANNDNANRTIVYSTTTPTALTPTWQNLGSTNFGTGVYNIAIGSEDLYVTCDPDGDNIPNHLDLDSDNDGCVDAMEGDENVTVSQLVTAGGTVVTGSMASNQNLCASVTCVNAQGVPLVVNSGGAADIGGDRGQGIGSSQNATVNSCACYNNPSTSTGIDSKFGITLLKRAGNQNGTTPTTNQWPMVRKSAHAVLESNTKGFVVTRVSTAGLSSITNPQEGMMVYDTTAKCLKIYDGAAWSCFSNPACP